MKVDLSKPNKQYDINNEEPIPEHKNEYIIFSQSQKCNKKEKVYKFEEEEKSLKLLQINHAPQFLIFMMKGVKR